MKPGVDASLETPKVSWRFNSSTSIFLISFFDVEKEAKEASFFCFIYFVLSLRKHIAD